MADTIGPNQPPVRTHEDKARRLQRRLWAAAKRAPGRRFHALYDRIHRSDVLWEAWERVRRNRGSAGLDAQSIAAVEEIGVGSFLEAIGAELRAGEYVPRAVMRHYIPKADGKRRPLGIPTVRDRVVQMAAKLVLEPIFEADFLPCSFGFRPKRSTLMALETLRKLGAKGGHHVLDADIRDDFGSIDHEKLMRLVAKRISDRRVLELIRQWLTAGVMEDGEVRANLAGTPQGGVISPLLFNIYLHVLDTLWMRHSAPLGELVRYAGDFVVMCKTKAQCEEAERRDLGALAATRVLPASLAERALAEADPAEGEGADAEGALPRGPPCGDRRPQPCAARLGQLLPHGERGHALQPDRHLRVAAAQGVASAAQGSSPTRG